MERKRTFVNQTFTCPTCGKIYKEPVNFCSDCGKCMSPAGENLEELQKKNAKLEILISLVDRIQDKQTLETIKKMIAKLKA